MIGTRDKKKITRGPHYPVGPTTGGPEPFKKPTAGGPVHGPIGGAAWPDVLGGPRPI
jgi:hypothetical protein